MLGFLPLLLLGTSHGILLSSFELCLGNYDLGKYTVALLLDSNPLLEVQAVHFYASRLALFILVDYGCHLLTGCWRVQRMRALTLHEGQRLKGHAP